MDHLVNGWDQIDQVIVLIEALRCIADRTTMGMRENDVKSECKPVSDTVSFSEINFCPGFSAPFGLTKLAIVKKSY